MKLILVSTSLFILWNLESSSAADELPVFDFPANEYIFSVNRDALIEAEKKFENRDSILTEDEQTVDHYLNYLKWREFTATKTSGFPPSRPIEKVLPYIKSTEIYQALKTLPKGGILHSHENQQLSRRRLMDIIWNSTDFQYFYMQSPTDPNRPWNLNFWANPPGKGNWIKVKGSAYSKEDIIRQQMMIPLMTDNHTNFGTDSEARWNLAKVVMGRGASSILSNRKIKPLYLTAMYEQGLEEGITYWETRRSVGPMYSVNPDPRFNGTSGKEVLPGGIGLDINITLDLVEKFTKLHPEFIGHKRIYYNTRQDSTASISRDVGIVAETMKTYSDHVLGWDLVGEEDAGNSLLYYLGNFVQLHDVETGKSKIPLYLHTGETNWLEDLLASGNNLDPVSTLQNSYEALLLNTKRIGHGLGFIKHPYLLQMLKERGIALEICTVSNQLLGYSPDIRNHPGQEFYRMGIPIALSGDDPATFGYDEVTVDWYEAYMAWGLNLGDLKKLALNSLMYSGMSDSEKKVAIVQKWKPMWNNYIKSKKLEACGKDYMSEARNEGRDVIFAQILPKQGAITGTTKVHLFGRNFEVGICRSIVCQFGSMNSTQAVYISNQHIVCQAPDFGDGKNRTVPVSITLDGNNFIDTGFNFTYMFEPITISGSVVNRSTTGNIALLFLSCLVAFRAIQSKIIFLI